MKKLLLIILFLAMTPTAYAQQAPCPTPAWCPPSPVNTSALPYQTVTLPGQLPAYQALEPLPSGFSNGTYTSVPEYLNAIYIGAITIGSLIAITMLVTSGIRIMLSESVTNLDNAKKRAVSAVWGLVLLVGSFVFLYTLNPNLLNFKLLIPNTQQAAQQYNWNPFVQGTNSNPAPGSTVPGVNPSNPYDNTSGIQPPDTAALSGSTLRNTPMNPDSCTMAQWMRNGTGYLHPTAITYRMFEGVNNWIRSVPPAQAQQALTDYVDGCNDAGISINQ